MVKFSRNPTGMGRFRWAIPASWRAWIGHLASQGKAFFAVYQIASTPGLGSDEWLSTFSRLGEISVFGVNMSDGLSGW